MFVVTVIDDGVRGRRRTSSLRWATLTSGAAGRPPARASGLSIARGIVEAHGGAIELERADRGTCLQVRLPVDRSEHAPTLRGGS